MVVELTTELVVLVPTSLVKKNKEVVWVREHELVVSKVGSTYPGSHPQYLCCLC